MEGRRGWSLEQLNLQPRTLRRPDLGVVGSGHHRQAHRMGGSTEQVARYKLGAALAEAAPYLLLLSATAPGQN